MLLGDATIVTQVLSVVKCSGFIGAGHAASVICRSQDASSGRCCGMGLWGMGLFLSSKGNAGTCAVAESSAEAHPCRGGGGGRGRVLVTEGFLGPGEGRRR